MVCCSSAMFSLSWNEVARRSAWTCLSCSIRSSPQTLAPSSTARSVPSSIHQRRPSSSKSLNPPKNEHRAISTPSEPAADAQTPVAEVPKQSSTLDAVQDPVTRHNEPRYSLPSVPSTQHLNPTGSFLHDWKSLSVC